MKSPSQGQVINLDDGEIVHLSSGLADVFVLNMDLSVWSELYSSCVYEPSRLQAVHNDASGGKRQSPTRVIVKARPADPV